MLLTSKLSSSYNGYSEVSVVTQFEHNILNEPEVFIYRLDSVLLRKKSYWDQLDGAAM